MERLFASLLRRIVKNGRLTLIDAKGKVYDCGDPSAAPVMFRLHDRRVAFDLLRNPQLTLGEAYMDGRISIDGGSIADLLDLIARNIGTNFGGKHLEWIAKARNLLRAFNPRNGVRRAKRNVAHHYDLSGQLYDLFLDSDKQYSCAFFERPTDSLETAQTNKKRRIAAKLDLKAGQRVLDIGSGWGGLALHLAESAKVDVKGITLSDEQLKVSRDRAAGSASADRVRFEHQDYRDATGPFERIVSVGMLEHVGIGQYDAFFAKVASLLTDDGVALIHAIGRSDGPGTTNAWITKYIFPGGYTPALSEVLPAIERAGLIVTDVEILRLHYALTLAEWRRRFVANWDRAKRLYDERFCRMWEYYLAGAEMGFRHQGLIVFQLQLAKRVDTLPLTRDYMMTSTAVPSRSGVVRAPDRKKAAA
ncbi:MAG: class I SAM-dependent methyltransferase [Alphaproteobacteria bacterium]|nr:class I SAM-dependent methyltransferase [Alphaproteobacteria bacterium]